MKFAVALALASTAMAGVAPRDATAVKAIMSTVDSDIASVKSAVDAYSGDKSDLVKAADQLISDLKSGKATVEGGPDLTASDAVELGSSVTELAKTGSGLTKALEGKKSQVEKAGECKTVLDKIAAISESSKGLIDAVSNKVPKNAKAIAEELAGELTTVLEEAEQSYKNCENSGKSGSTASTGAGSSGSATATGTGSATATQTKPESVTTSAPNKGSATGTGGVTATSSQVTIPTGAAALYAPAGVLAAVAAALAL